MQMISSTKIVVFKVYDLNVFIFVIISSTNQQYLQKSAYYHAKHVQKFIQTFHNVSR